MTASSGRAMSLRKSFDPSRTRSKPSPLARGPSMLAGLRDGGSQSPSFGLESFVRAPRGAAERPPTLERGVRRVVNRRSTRRRAPIGIVLSAGLASLGLSGPAAAQETGPYVLLGSGVGVVGSRDAEIVSDAVDIEYQDGGLADLSLGYRVARHVRVEANLNYRQHHIDNIDGEGVDGFAHKGDVHVLGALANVLLDVPLGEQIERDSLPYAIPYVGVGLGVLWTKPRAELRQDPVQKIRGEEAEFAWNVLAGVDVPITRRVGLQVGYRYLESRDAKWQLRTGETLVGYVDAPYRAHEARVGIRIGY